MEIEVVNKKRCTSERGEYIGRPSVLGNQFIIVRDGSRAEVIELYRAWLRRQWKEHKPARRELIKLARDLKVYGKLRLVCWCKPLPCHGDVIAEAVRGIVSTGLV